MNRKAHIFLLTLCLVTTALLGFTCYLGYCDNRILSQKASVLESEILTFPESTAPDTETVLEISESENFTLETAQTKTMENSSITESEASVHQDTDESEVPAETAPTYTVVIDPGHQGSWIDMSAQEPNAPGSTITKAKATTGTIGSYTGIPEYQLNLDISLALRTELENRRYHVVLTRTDNDTAISNAQRATLAYEEGGDIYVRIHANGSDDHSVSGALGMTPSYENPYVGYLAEDSYRLTECILNAYCEETGLINLGIQYHDDMTGINWSRIPVMILEMGFMTNESDDYNMADNFMRHKMVTGIANGIDAYFGRQ